MRIAIGADHAGFELKEAVKAFLAAEDREVLDVGTSNKDPVDYPDSAAAVGEALREHRADRGIILCGSGAADALRPVYEQTTNGQLAHIQRLTQVKAAQARGDFQVLVERDRRALRVHLGADVAAGLARLQAGIAAALTD